MEERKKKFYNPYPFMIKVLNDKGKPQILAPQAHCKIFKDDLSRIAITLLPKSKQREYRDNLGLELEELTKVKLISIALTVLVEESEEELNKMIKADIIVLIRQKTGEEEQNSRQNIDLPDEEEIEIIEDNESISSLSSSDEKESAEEEEEE